MIYLLCLGYCIPHSHVERFFQHTDSKADMSDARTSENQSSAEAGGLRLLAQIMGHDPLDTTMLYMQGTKQDLHHDVEGIA